MTKSVFVTGASSGIGYALCESFLKRGFKVFGCCPEWELQQMNPLVEKGVTALSCDITNTQDILRVKKIILEETNGRLDYLYNNAGIAAGGPACESTDAVIERIFRVNVFGHIAMTREFIDAIKLTKGTVVFTASVAGRAPLPFISLYCATKAAIDQYAHVLSMEMKPFGVHVVSVITGGVNTAVGDKGADSVPQALAYNVPGIKECGDEVAFMARRCPIPVQPHEYAENVVSYLEKGNPALNIYQGGMAWVLNYLGRYTPVWLHEYFLAKHFKFDVVARNIRKREAEKSK